MNRRKLTKRMVTSAERRKLLWLQEPGAAASLQVTSLWGPNASGEDVQFLDSSNPFEVAYGLAPASEVGPASPVVRQQDHIHDGRKVTKV